MEKEPNPNLGGFVEKFTEEGIFVHNREKVKIGDTVEVLSKQGPFEPGQKLVVKNIVIEPDGNKRGFLKWLLFEGSEQVFDPKKFKLVK